MRPPSNKEKFEKQFTDCNQRVRAADAQLLFDLCVLPSMCFAVFFCVADTWGYAYIYIKGEIYIKEKCHSS